MDHPLKCCITIIVRQPWEELVPWERTPCMALIQTCQIQATAVKLQCCHIWQVELSKLSLLQLSFSIHSSNGVNCPIKFFHLKIAIGLALGDSWGVACATTEKHWCPVSTFACFPGKAFLGKPTISRLVENTDANVCKCKLMDQF